MAIPDFNITPDIGKLKDYSRIRLLLAEQLRIIRHNLRSNGTEKLEQKFEELMVKLAEDRFTLTVLGQFKRGKSSLMNAIIGKDLLPTGVTPVTSAITTLKYGPVEHLVVNRENSKFPEEHPASSLSDFVTEKGNPANIKKVKTACLEIPVPFLRYGIEFVDTPGVGSAILPNTVTAYRFLPESDSVIFVTGVDTPITDSELELLQEIKKYVTRTFFVVNKIDLASPEESREVLDYIAETIRSSIGQVQIKIFPVSTRQGFDAKISGNLLLYEKSGLKDLEEALGSFLSTEKSGTFLAAVTHKAISVLENEVKLPSGFQTTDIVMQNSLAELKNLYLSIIKGRIDEFEINKTRQGKNKVKVPSKTPEKDFLVNKINIEFDLKTRGCPVCNHIIEQIINFLYHWQYEISNDTQAQTEFASGLGFCPLHTWQLLAVSSSHGASVGFISLTEEIARIIKRAIITGEKDLEKVFQNIQNCHVCKLHRKSEKDYIRRLAAFLNIEDGRSKYQGSQGVCLVHLRMLLDSVKERQTLEFLLTHASHFYEEVAEDMRTYSLKVESLRRALKNINEEDAYLRAIIHLAGDRGIATAWPLDKEI